MKPTGNLHTENSNETVGILVRTPVKVWWNAYFISTFFKYLSYQLKISASTVSIDSMEA